MCLLIPVGAPATDGAKSGSDFDGLWPISPTSDPTHDSHQVEDVLANRADFQCN